MKYLLSVCALFALLAVGCGEDVVVNSSDPSAPAPYSGPPGDVMEVDSEALTSTLAANELTLVDFTAVW